MIIGNEYDQDVMRYIGHDNGSEILEQVVNTFRYSNDTHAFKNTFVARKYAKDVIQLQHGPHILEYEHFGWLSQHDCHFGVCHGPLFDQR